VKASRVQCDEIWSFCYAKEKTAKTLKDRPEGAGDVWTWTALDADTKLIVSFYVGDRSGSSAIELMDDLRARLANRVQLTTDGHKAYLDAVEGAFGADVDYAQLIKLYGPTITAPGRYSPAECIGAMKHRIEGNPDIKHVSTSYVERQNLNMRMGMRRFTRLTNAFSKKLENHIHALALYFVFYNLCRIHKTLRVTPGMEAGITDRVWSFEDIVAKMDAMAPAPMKRGPYKKRAA
jgi:IS1 family transposase